MKEKERFSKLSESMLEQMRNAPVALAQNAALLMGKTVAQLRASVTKVQIGLGKLQNLPMASRAAAEQGLDTGYATPADVKTHVDVRLRGFTGDAGDSFFLNENGFSSFIPGRFYEQLALVTTQAELDTMLTVEEKMADVFHNWKKISRGNWKATTPELTALGFSDTAIQAELDAFVYDEATGKIKNPADTLSFVGFISPFGFDNFVLDVVLRSDSTWQNDPMGLIVGYVTDPDGTTHTLSVMFNPWGPNIYGGAKGVVNVYVDYNTIGKVMIREQRQYLHWVDGTDATGVMNPSTPGPFAVKPWVLATNGVRLRITRTGDTFKVETTEYDSTVFVDAATFTIDLNSHPSLARFKGPQRYGYAAISQDNAIWDVLQRPGARQAIVDLRDRSVREWDGTKWVVTTDGWSRLIKPNRFYHNTTTKRLFYAENETTVIPVL